MYATNRKPSLLLLALLLCSGGAGLYAQSLLSDFVDIRPKLNSPLSRIGLGDALDQPHAVNGGMGGMFSTYQDGYHLNIQNPASLASLTATSFELGLYGRLSNLEDQSGSIQTNQGNLRYLALGFPLRNPINLNLDQQDDSWNAGMAFSLAPTSVVGYDLLLQGGDEEFGQTSNVLKGNGGAYRFSWSNGFRYRALSAGVNLNYNFGKITNSRLVLFNELPESLASELLEETSISGATFGYGLQYAYDFKSVNEAGELAPNGKRILLGVSGQIGGGIESESNQTLRRFSPTGQFSSSDTIRFVEGQTGKVTLPSSITAGVAFEDINRLYVGVEVGMQNTSNYANSAQPDELMDANRIAFGIQYIPNISSYNSYLKRVRYRFGVRLEDDPRAVNGVQARRNAITLGAGFPLRLPRNQVSFLDFALEFGQFGVPNVLDENYVQLTVGFSLNDNSWFFKRKLN
ncbi:hypothetical protein [Neolewinella antarctica]|uniref:Uncharacterized protein n=1 Tax=Neolewinella antarctica TaxID=442734 RepID=A0ABX0XBJ0_9BACT|nr:hypothetical protein [Neolewinella antarctica]NJC26572.1 hypothetical protein [Neolewinella antarctica]